MAAAVTLRERIRLRIARHENWFTFLWYLHLVKNEDPRKGGDHHGQDQV